MTASSLTTNRPHEAAEEFKRRAPRNWPLRRESQAVLFAVFQLVGSLARADTLGHRYAHTSWDLRHGFKHFPVQALAQTDDGHLWIGTPGGLWRFDGSQFVEWRSAGGSEPQLPSKDVWSLRAAENNGLWIGTSAGLSKLEGGRLTPFEAWNNIGGVRALLDVSPRGLWAGTSSNRGGTLIVAGPFDTAPLDSGDPLISSGVNAIFEDHSGSLWVGTRRGLRRWSSGKSDAFLTKPATEIYSITEDSQHRIIVASSAPGGLLYLSDGRFLPLTVDPPLASGPRVVMADRTGSIWAGTFSTGLIEISQGRVSHMTRADGLSGGTVQALHQDRDGNVWVGTRTGLDRLQRTRVSQLSREDGLSDDLVTALYGGRDGSVWIATAKGGINRFDRERMSQIRMSEGLPSDSVLSICEDSWGRLWAGTAKGVAVRSGPRFRPVLKPDGAPLGRVTPLAADDFGHVWAFDVTRGLYEVGSGVARLAQAEGLPRSNDAYAILADREGGLWIGYYHGALAYLKKHGSVNTYMAGRELAPGAVLGLAQDRYGAIWVASSGGVSCRRDGSWRTWRVADGALPGPIFQIVFDDLDGLWLATADGFLNFARSELDYGRTDRLGPSTHTRYGADEGINPQVAVMRAQPRAGKSRDGRLWFANEAGVAIIDPTQAIIGVPAPRLVIENVQADGRTIPMDGEGGECVVFGGRELQVDYRSIALSGSQDALFRYRLVGFDPDWVPAAAGRRARYTNLPPGAYQFEVATSVAPGRWQGARRPLTVVVRPAFYRTFAFRLLCACVICTLLYGAYHLRLRQISRRCELLSRERLDERARIARDLHDTMLQSVVGVSLQLDALSRMLHSAGERFEADLRRIRRQVDQVLVETRHALWALRAPSFEQMDLPSAIEHARTILASPGKIKFVMNVRGAPLRFAPDVEEDLFRITNEAIANAVRHSGCRQVETELTYSHGGITIRIDDDGRGFGTYVSEPGRAGHFGLRGMHERASRLGAELVVASSAAGTRITLTMSPGRGSNVLALIRRRVLRGLSRAQSDSARSNDVRI